MAPYDGQKLLEDEIVRVLTGLTSSFEPNELAYLALTSKVEAPVRDRLAFTLHQSVGSDYLVAREWDRVDLAILSRSQVPVALLELKAMYSFDDAMRYCLITAEDEAKTRSFAPQASAVYSLLLATHVSSQVPQGLRRVVKYDGHINRAARKVGDPELVRTALLARMDEALRERNLVASGNLAGGIAFELPVDVFYWLVRDPGPVPVALEL
ncbi:hypothetical protein VW35_04140 [Devosia soli]|uniref:Uncharacterized protein n=1 Tax=Devosia soli TaxID=361041 RepID=A0A0F5LC00_9HYPH|nr:hypothetical protein [Devosia soli]KKB79714.1 hypothetical protein VW35_04140 [Devosia soli]